MSDQDSKPLAVLDTSYIISYVTGAIWTVGADSQIKTLGAEVTYPKRVVEEYVAKQEEGLIDDCGNPQELPNLTEEAPDLVRHARKPPALEKMIARQWRRTRKGRASEYLNPDDVDSDVVALAVEQAMQQRTVYVVAGDFDIIDAIERINAAKYRD